MKKSRKIILWLFLALFILIFLFTIAYIIIKFVQINGQPIGDEAAIGIFSLVGSFVGTFFVAFELKNSTDATCCQMLVELNNYFHDNERLMRVYGVLDKAYLWGEKAEDRWKEVDDEDVEAFCTFFENLYLLVEHRIAHIKDLNDIFGYRFFLFMNNPHIQEKYLLTTSSSFANLFKLYELWIEYRDKQNRREKDFRYIIGNEFRFTKEYLENRTYMVDKGVSNKEYMKLEVKGHNLVLKEIWFDQISDVLSLQSEVKEGMEDKSLFVEETRSELIDSLHRDYVIGAYKDNKLIGVTIIVKNRNSYRNLALKCQKEYKDSYTFDSVFVKKEYRGLGLQDTFVDLAIALAKKENIKLMWSTVSNKNKYSHENMLTKGFKVYEKDVDMYGGFKRDILRLEIK